ncbi:MAG TPA: hypothetical protein DCP92_16670 [Nitrospiraceae bacterium]|nr:hypothetical protein [Nitrospiraceae bacterium]
MSVREKIFGGFSFAILIAGVIIALKIMNWLPTAFQEGVMKRYDSIEQVRAALNIKEIYIPTYFPQSLTWPPSLILAQSKPFEAVIIGFNSVGKDDITLIISQSAASGFSPDEKIKLVHIKDLIKYSLKGRDALIEVGTDKNGALCSRIAWIEGNFRIRVTLKSTPFDLIKIAESMVH